MKKQISVTKKDIIKIAVLAVIFMLFFFAGFFVNRSTYNSIMLSNSSSNIDVWQTVGIWVGSIGTIAAIVFVVINTNRQIKNQNKESHRPYITVSNITRIADDFSGSALENDYNKKNYDFYHGYNLMSAKSYEVFSQNLDNVAFNEIKKSIFQINIKNIGYGVACNIHFVGINNASIYNTKDGEDEGDVFSTLDLGLYKKKSLHFILSSHFDVDKNGKYISFTKDFAPFLAFYTDMHGNTYSTMIIISIRPKGFLNHTVYPHGTKNFEIMMEKYNVDYDKFLNKYKEDEIAHNK